MEAFANKRGKERESYFLFIPFLFLCAFVSSISGFLFVFSFGFPSSFFLFSHSSVVTFVFVSWAQLYFDRGSTTFLSFANRATPENNYNEIRQWVEEEEEQEVKVEEKMEQEEEKN